MNPGNIYPDDHNKIALEENLKTVAKNVSRSLESECIGVFCRKPIIDPDYPETSDVDLVAIWDGPEERPERLTIPSSLGEVFVDLLWIPSSALMEPQEAAGYRMLPHLLLESEVMWLRPDWIFSLVDQIRLKAYEMPIWKHRLSAHVQFGDSAFREAQRNIDFSPAALFFLQTASSYYLIALNDCLKRSVMSLLSRPITKLRLLDHDEGLSFEESFITNLNLAKDVWAALRDLKEIYDVVADKCPKEPTSGMNIRTGGHYAYSISPLETEYRQLVAKAMIKRSDYANAVFYIRFWAYSLLRCPIVVEEAKQGKNPSFYVPFKPLLNSLQVVCPEIIDYFTSIMGGKVIQTEIEVSLEGTSKFRSQVLEEIRKKGFEVTFDNNE